MLRVVTALSFSLFISACVVDMSTTEQDLDSTNGAIAEPHDAKVVHVRGQARPTTGGSPNLVYHGGPVMTAGAYVEPIFWGTSWASTSYQGDKVSGLQTFYAGLNNTSYAGTNSEYTDGSGTHVGTASTLAGVHIDTSASAKNGSRTSVILAEVCKMISNPRSDGYYPVYIDKPRGHAGYCAWHSTGTCNGVQVQFAFFFDLDGDTGCDPQDSVNGHSQGLAALANVSGHELSEAVTDPQLDAWYDTSGAENSDKCAWAFGSDTITFSNNSHWKIQGNWSNAAYNGGTGYANRDGQ
ncbi:MAG TPA: hypothetical protein VIV40_32260, partial [Kofleriaceae bacterium]